MKTLFNGDKLQIYHLKHHCGIQSDLKKIPRNSLEIEL